MALLVLLASIVTYDGKPNSDAEVLLAYGMLGLSFPSSLVVAATASMVGQAVYSQTGHFLTTSYTLIIATWFVFFAVGYLQWFVLLPWLWRKWKAKRSASAPIKPARRHIRPVPRIDDLPPQSMSRSHCMRVVRALLLCGLSWNLAACAAQTAVGRLVVDVPHKWHIKNEGPGSFTASPKDDMGLPVLNVQTCERTESRCATPCEADKIRANFFYFAADAGRFEFTERQRSDGSMEYGVSGTVGEQDGVTQIASNVICSERGIAFLSLMSKEPREAVKCQLELTVSTVRWGR